MLLPRRRARSMGRAYLVDVLAVDAIAVHLDVGVHLALQIMHISGYLATAIERVATPSIANRGSQRIYDFPVILLMHALQILFASKAACR